MNVVELKDVGQQYGRAKVLQDIQLAVAQGEVLGLFGHNGAGKTTTIKLILGLLNPTVGRVQVLGRDPTHSRVRERLGYLPENVTFYPHLTGRETLHHLARLKGAKIAQANDLLEQVGLSHAADGRVKTYSKGMRQRLGLAQALLGVPQLLLLDEPTVGLDPIATQDLYALIDKLRQQGTSVILCSHVLPGIERYIDRAAILSQGRLQASGTIHQLRKAADLPVRVKAFGLNGGAAWCARWQQAGHQTRLDHEGDVQILVQDGRQMEVVRELATEALARDVEVHHPSLEDLYRYYMRTTELTSAGIMSG